MWKNEVDRFVKTGGGGDTFRAKRGTDPAPFFPAAGTTKGLLKVHDLTYMEFDALTALRSQKQGVAMKPTELYSALLISSGGLTKVLKSLESKSYIARSCSHDDARQRPVLLADKGRQKLAEIMPEIAKNAERLLQNGFESTDACGAFADELKRIIQAAEDEIEQHTP